MLRVITSALILLALSAVTGCASGPTLPPPTADELAAADYGKKPASFNQTFVGFLHHMNFKDPESLKVRNVSAYKQYRTYEETRRYGYLICGEYDAKNGFGGYSGYQKAGYFVHDDLAYGINSSGTDYLSNSQCRNVNKY